jgi:hypothetical protein
VLAALAAGRPLVVVPTEFDKPDNARRVEATGAGLVLAPRRCTPRRLRAAVSRVLRDPSFRANAERLAVALARPGGARRAAELVDLAPRAERARPPSESIWRGNEDDDETRTCSCWPSTPCGPTTWAATGIPGPTSPYIDAMARGVLAEHVYCSALPTYPRSRPSTRVSTRSPTASSPGGKAQLAKESPFLTQSFLEAGYTTCAVDNLNRARQWFARGYEFYVDPSLRRTLLLGVTCEELNRRAIHWLRTHADEPFFMLIHYWDPHWPYAAPPSFRNLFYDGGNPTDPKNRALEEWWTTPLGAMARDTWLRTADGLVTDPAYVSALYDQEIVTWTTGSARV